MREHGFVSLAINDLLIRIARCLDAALLGDARVIIPEMLLARHAFDRGALLLPYRGDVEQHVRLPAALLRLVRLEQKDRRGAKHALARLMAMRLGDDAGVLSKVADGRMVAIVRVPARMREHEKRMDGAIDIDEPAERFFR